MSASLPHGNGSPRTKEQEAHARTILDNPALRELLLLQHPLISQDEIFPTAPIVEYFHQVVDLVEVGTTGAWGAAPPGSGKTCALLYCEAVLPSRMPGVLTAFFGIQTQQQTSVRAFHMRGLEAVGHPLIKGETYVLRRRLLNKIIDDARMCRAAIFVLFVDEAQAMTPLDLRFMKDLHNDLSRAGLLMICILMGQNPDMSREMKKLSNDLIGRFAIQQLVPRGYGTQDIEATLGHIDAATFSDELAIALPEFYAPRAFGRGWRLVHESVEIAEEIERLFAAQKATQIPAREFFHAIRHFLAAIKHLDGTHTKWPAGLWRKALAHAQMTRALTLQQSASHS